MVLVSAGMLLIAALNSQHPESEFYALDYIAFRGSCATTPVSGRTLVSCDHIELGEGEQINERQGSRVEAVFAGRSAFTFAGTANLARTNGRFPVDHVVLPDSTRLDATGQCAIERTGDRLSRVTCVAKDRRGRSYVGQFLPAKD